MGEGVTDVCIGGQSSALKLETREEDDGYERLCILYDRVGHRAGRGSEREKG